MSVECFLDTNVVLYAVSSSPGEVEKKTQALALLTTADFGLSAQVLQEFYVNATRKVTVPLTPHAAVALIDELRRFPLVPTDEALVLAGVEASLEFGISYWDGAIIAAAERLGARVLYSEDLNHGQTYGSVRVVNPFRREGSGNRVHEPDGLGYG